MIEIKTGDIFESGAYALVNAVNCIGVMGAGIALKFAQKYPEMLDEYKIDCIYGRYVLGEVRPYVGYLVDGKTGPMIFNFPTMEYPGTLSRLSEIDKGLQSLARQCSGAKVPSIAIPGLGCGFGRLPFEAVKARIEARMNLPGIHVMIYEPAKK